jgi:outer membrane lipoprotein carrier protein
MLLCLGSSAYANGDDVDRFLNDFEENRGKIETYSGKFVQKRTLDLFGETRISTGNLLYKAPQKMIWKYETPDIMQMRVAREAVSFYFPDLEQIEIYPSNGNTGDSGFFFAFEATGDDLKKSFEITVSDGKNKTRRIDLLPKSGALSSQLAAITLLLDESNYLPREILIREKMGDSTTIELSDIKVNEPIADDEMEFNAPEGTTIIEGGFGAF